MLSFIKGFGWNFIEHSWEPTREMIDNPGRGWYRIYTYQIGKESFERPVRYEGESLALVLLDIGAYRDRELDGTALTQMQEILNCFVELGFELIVRACYDTEGKGMVKEPSLFSLVKTHFAQIGRVLLPYADKVFVYQGVLLGNWGEMHESKFLSSNNMKDLICLFVSTTEGRIPLAVRKPVQYRMAFSEDMHVEQLGFFNDGILGSKTHLGTFAGALEGKGAWKEMWSPKEETLFLNPFLDKVPYGGEVLWPGEDLKAQEMLEILKSLRISYLNIIHEEHMLKYWRQLDFEGESFFEYVGERLGYCFQVREARIRLGRRWECNVLVENVGFGSLYDKVEALLWKRQKGSSNPPLLIGRMEGDLMGMMCGEKRNLQLTFEAEKESCEGWEFLISLQREKDKRQIFFAQKAVDGKVLLGELRKGR